MINPNVACKIQHPLAHDVYGEEQLSAPVGAVCNVVRLVVRSEKTSVRADSSASGGAADELTSVSRLLFKPLVKISIGDKVTVHNIELKVETLHPRFDVRGRHHHNEVDLTIWA